jgi:hypothetical protein
MTTSWLNPSALKMETACFSETLVSTYKSTQRYNPEEQHRHITIISLNFNEYSVQLKLIELKFT